MNLKASLFFILPYFLILKFSGSCRGRQIVENPEGVGRDKNYPCE